MGEPAPVPLPPLPVALVVPPPAPPPPRNWRPSRPVQLANARARAATEIIPPEAVEIGNALGALFESGECADVAFMAEGKRILAHKSILCVRCSYFDAMFREEGGLKEAHAASVILDGVPYDSFRELLRFLYTGRLRLLEDNVVELLHLGSEFLLPEVKDICVDFILSNLDIDIAPQVVMLAIELNLSELQTQAEAFCVEHFEEILNSEHGFSEIDPAIFENIGKKHEKTLPTKPPKPPPPPPRLPRSKPESNVPRVPFAPPSPPLPPPVKAKNQPLMGPNPYYIAVAPPPQPADGCLLQ